MGHVGSTDMSTLSQRMCSCYCQPVLPNHVSMEMATACIIETNRGWASTSACLESKGNKRNFFLGP